MSHTSHAARHATPDCMKGAQEAGACACSCLMQADASDMSKGLGLGVLGAGIWFGGLGVHALGEVRGIRRGRGGEGGEGVGASQARAITCQIRLKI